MARSRLRSLLALSTIAIAGSVGVAGSVAAGGSAVSITASPATVTPSGSMVVTISGASCVPGGAPVEVFELRLYSYTTDSYPVPPVSLTSDQFSGGTFTNAAFVAPATAGKYDLRIVGRNGCVGSTATATFMVAAAGPTTTVPPATTVPGTTVAPTGPTTSVPTLPATGGGFDLAPVAALLCLAGGGVVLLTRRQRLG